jgi:putative ATPase
VADFVPFSAVMGGMKEIREVMAAAERTARLGRRTLLFVDEIHRFNKAQQDAFLPYVERGDIILIGATTENPSFEVNAALLSRMRVFTLRQLSEAELEAVVQRGLALLERKAEAAAINAIVAWASGDARSALNILELAANITPNDAVISAQDMEGALQKRTLLYDKGGEEHYNLISALHKSVRSSDVDAALYWLARMLEAGEDRMYLARRLVRMAVEDIGMADPRAVEVAMACQQTVHFLGEPEGDQALAQITIYLAVAAKSDAAYRALNEVRALVRSSRAEPVPLQLRNAPTKLMKELGYGAGYQHAHMQADAMVDMQCLPDALVGSEFYQPTNRGLEAKISERLQQLRARHQRSKAEDA